MIRATRKAVYDAFLDPASVATWLPPSNMTGRVHIFEPREGGRFRMSLTYRTSEHAAVGKTSANTDTFAGRFVELIPDSKIVEVVEFESQDPSFAGKMTITITFLEAKDGTEITFLCEDIPKGIRPEDNEQGCKESLEKLAALLE